MKLIGPQLKRVGVLVQYGKYVSTVLDNAMRELDEKSSTCLLGAIAGDLNGSINEFAAPKSTDFLLFTPSSLIIDDSILTLAVAHAILNQGSYRDRIQEYARAYPGKGKGGFFGRWIYADDPQPYRSFGNGSAMRVSAVGWVFNTVDDVLGEAEASAAVTRNHPEGIKGAQAVALAIFLG
jgi:ADP-ribosyl-[dinitrogen reductase] hydrolase